MRESVDHMRGRFSGLGDALAVVYDAVRFDLAPDASVEIVRSIRYRLCEALHAERRSVLKDIRIAKLRERAK